MNSQLRKMFKLSIALSMSVLYSTMSTAQCDSWEAYPRGKSKAEDQHVIYRGFFKNKEYAKAFPVWEELFKYVKSPKEAPRRHFQDGIKMYQERIKAEFAKKDTMDKAKADADLKVMVDLYDQMAICTGEESVDRAYQAYYMNRFKADPLAQIQVMDKAIELGGNEVHYIIFFPYLNVAVWLYQNQKEGFDEEYIRTMHAKFKAIADYNVANKTKYAAKYEEKWKKWEKRFQRQGRSREKSLEDEVFACDYYVAKYKPLHEADPKNEKQNEKFMKMLLRKCGEESDLYLAIKTINDEILAERLKTDFRDSFERACAYEKSLLLEKKHTIYKELTEEEIAANKKEAKKWVKEALDNDPDCIPQSKRADIAYRIGYDEYKAGRYSSARRYMRLASQFRPNWGKPYMLVGTMYAASGKRCDSYSKDGVGMGPEAQVVAWIAVDEWKKAKSVDSSVNAAANNKINTYRKYFPSKGEVFQRKDLNWKEGGSYTVGCWIQQKTTIRLRSSY